MAVGVVDVLTTHLVIGGLVCFLSETGVLGLAIGVCVCTGATSITSASITCMLGAGFVAAAAAVVDCVVLAINDAKVTFSFSSGGVCSGMRMPSCGSLEMKKICLVI